MRVCSICGSTRNIEAAHVVGKGMGGLGKKATPEQDDTHDLCAGTGGNTDPNSCHGAKDTGLLKTYRHDDGLIRFMVTPNADSRKVDAFCRRLKRAGLTVHPGQWHVARFEGADPDTMGESA